MVRNLQSGKKTDQQMAMNVSAVSIIVNIVLSLFKLVAGIIAKSGAMVSDGVHSASDVFSTIIVIIGVNISSKESDEEHQYGHERLECVASIILSTILLITGIGIGISGIEKIVGGNYGKLEVPGTLALIAAIISIGVKEWMFWYTRATAKIIRSGVLMADAWHHRSDALSSVGAFVGIFGSRMGWHIMDPLASVVICVFILKAVYDIFKDAVNKMIDRSCDDETCKKIENTVLAQDGVIGIDSMRTRLFGAKIYVDLEISADGDKTLTETHAIAERVHDIIEKEFETVKHCMVHVNPAAQKIDK